MAVTLGWLGGLRINRAREQAVNMWVCGGTAERKTENYNKYWGWCA